MTFRSAVALAVLSMTCCGESEPASTGPKAMDLDVAWANIQNWSGLDSNEQEGIRDGYLYAHTRLLVPADDGHGVVFIAHVGWCVVLASLAPDLSVRDVDVKWAKCGYSVSCEGGLVVTMHKHPGTGMFWNEPYRVDSSGGGLALIPVDPDSEASVSR